MKMSKVFVTLISTALLLVAANAFALTGACVSCHTMHNSQNGAAMTFDGSATPNSTLLRAGTCGGCHADATVNTGGNGIGNLAIPQVDATTIATMPAGGSFNWVKTMDSTGHNVSDLGIAVDVALNEQPPGFDETINTDINGGVNAWSTQLTCAGTNGCHGDHTTGDVFNAVKGAHHDNAGGNLTTATTVGNSYRFLLGIKGGEDDDWEQTVSATDHNVYYGAARTTTTPNPTDTISSLCAQCHGKFHSGVDIGGGNMSSPWVRHPTDINMVAVGGEYAAYVYNVEAPVALSTLPAAVNDATSYASEKIVTCVSCHRAHGSDQPDLLRWDYGVMNAGTVTAAAGTGCFRCHTTKDGI
ncbi:MAG TPA: cytochrome c3 family protein [Malonomonas sp.]